jgi:hypothetical protein
MLNKRTSRSSSSARSVTAQGCGSSFVRLYRVVPSCRVVWSCCVVVPSCVVSYSRAVSLCRVVLRHRVDCYSVLEYISNGPKALLCRCSSEDIGSQMLKRRHLLCRCSSEDIGSQMLKRRHLLCRCSSEDIGSQMLKRRHLLCRCSSEDIGSARAVCSLDRKQWKYSETPAILRSRIIARVGANSEA